MLNAYTSYCVCRKWEPRATIEAVSVKTLYNFFYWILHGRRKTLRSVGTLETYWKAFCLVRERCVGGKLDKIIVVQMKDVSNQFDQPPPYR